MGLYCSVNIFFFLHSVFSLIQVKYNKKCWKHSIQKIVQVQVNWFNLMRIHSLCLRFAACVCWVSVKVTMQTIPCVCVCRCVYFCACGLCVWVFVFCVHEECVWVCLGVMCVCFKSVVMVLKTNRFCLITPQRKNMSDSIWQLFLSLTMGRTEQKT